MDRSVTNFNVRLRTIKIRELIVGIIIAMVISTILEVIFPVMDESGELFMTVFLLIGAVMYIWALRGTTGIGGNVKNIFKFNILKEIFYVFAINLLFAFLFTFLISYLDFFISLTDPTWISIWNMDNVDMDSGAIILDAIGAIIFAPVLEELTFRGVLFNRMKIRVGIIPAMIISSFLFGIGHDFGGITSAFLFGLCMCILYLKTDNILVPMTVHCINNTVATVMELNGLDIIISQFPWIIPFTIISLISTFYLIKYIIQESGKVKKEYS